jgi:hypothetical protein
MKTLRNSRVQPYLAEEKIQSRKIKIWLLVGMLALSSGSLAQDAIPIGTILPLQLNSSLNSKNSKPGQIISARIMQDVPLPSGLRIRAGSRAVGRILEVIEARNGNGAKVRFQFDMLEVSKRKISITTNLRALASMMEVNDAQVPKTGSDRGESQNSWTTEQIGGDVVYRGGGPVAKGLTVVGTPAPNGVLDRIASNPGMNCHGSIDGNDQFQALWVFSADACGTYGFPDLTVIHAGRSDPEGQITLASHKDNFDIRRGSGLLLRVR